MYMRYLNKISVNLFLLFVFTNLISAQTDTTSIAFISDTQTPIFIERLWLRSNNNEKATEAIFEALAETRISALFHLGDITSVGFIPGTWKAINKYFLSLQLLGIPIYPALGNHEYLIFPSSGEKMFFKNFPDITSSWYVKIIGSIAVVILNSNFSHLSDMQISEQREWFKNQIIELDNDPRIKFIIVGAHHSPYTNSKVVSPSSEVQDIFLPIFFESPKCRIFLSGHAHTFEHFRMRDKDFMVIGGGGGLLQPLVEEQRFPDQYQSDKRTFHFVLCSQINDALTLSIRMINPDYKSFSEVYRINITAARN